MKQIAFTSMIVLGALASDKDHCHALVLSGGGNNGAYEMGVLWGLVHYGNPKDFEWDVVTGVSAGAINTCGLCAFKPEDGLKATEYFSEFWTSLKDEDIYVSWGALGWLDGILKHNALYDNTPLGKTLSSAMKEFGPDGFQRRASVSSVNLNTGDYDTFDQKNTLYEDYWNACLASSSIPGIFAPHKWNDGVYMDGGTIYNVNVEAAIQQCLEVVDDPSKITVDIAMCSYDSEKVIDETGHTLDNYWESMKIHHYYNSVDTIQEIKRAYPTVDWRYLFAEKKKASGFKELNFANETTWPLQEEGRADAQAAILAGKGKAFAHLDTWSESEELQTVYPIFADFLQSMK